MPVAGRLLLAVDQLQDPGNLGTILRSAEAAGVDHVLLLKGTVDPYSPKVVRSGMGAHFRLPIANPVTWEEISVFAGNYLLRIADADAKRPYFAEDWTRPSILVIGNEGIGVSKEGKALAQSHVTIPMSAGVESLNAAIAASVILFEARRQQSLASMPTIQDQ